MIKIAFVGGPDTGKTDMARWLTLTLNRLGYRAQEVVEYWQTYVRRYAGQKPPDLLDQVMAFWGQVRRENDFRDCDFVVCDTLSSMAHVFAIARGVLQTNERDSYVVETLRRWGVDQLRSYRAIFHLAKVPCARTPLSGNLAQSKKDDLAKRIDSYLLVEGVSCIPIDAADFTERHRVVMDYLTQNIDGFADRLRMHHVDIEE